ncbi:MAG: ABC transporter, partial [Hyphomonadaceae bacterium]|nr:ABC transporter [Hyphomonadaceae bacterium]
MTDISSTQAQADRPSAGAIQSELMAEAAAKRARSSNLRPLLRLLPYLTRRPADLAAAGVFSVVAAAATLALPLAAKYLVDRGL